MSSFHRQAAVALASLILSAPIGCSRTREPAPGAAAAGQSGNAMDEDVRQLARSTEKTAKDLGHATTEALDKAGQHLDEAAKKAGAGGEDAWLTTKVKAELVREGFDPLRVHVDTDHKLVTLSGTVESAARREKAVALATHIEGVGSVTDHLFVQPAETQRGSR
jgi:osmotically-inducible protein OsmY